MTEVFGNCVNNGLWSTKTGRRVHLSGAFGELCQNWTMKSRDKLRGVNIRSFGICDNIGLWSIETSRRVHLSGVLGSCVKIGISRKRPDTIRSLSASQPAQRPSPIVSNGVTPNTCFFSQTIILWSCWPAERLLTVLGPFLEECYRYKILHIPPKNR